MQTKYEKGSIKYVIILAVILGIVFASQQSYFKEIGKNVLSSNSGDVQKYLSEGSSWLKQNVYPKIGLEAEKRGEIIKNEVEEQKENISESVSEKIKNYFSGIVDSVIHPNSTSNNQTCNQTCQPTQ